MPARLSDGAQRTKVQAKDIGGGGYHFAKIPVDDASLYSGRKMCQDNFLVIFMSRNREVGRVGFR